MTQDMRRTWLIQRLNKPHVTAGVLGKDNPFSFGGGLRNGGLSDTAMDLIRPLFSFDYMGAAEFEFGEVPRALQNIARYADAGDLAAWSFRIPLKTVEPHREDRDKPAPEGSGVVYVLSPEAWKTEIKKRIRGYAKNPYHANNALKEHTRIERALRPHGDPDSREYEWDTETIGWLELDNGYMFFVDEETWRKTAELFGVVVDD